jgi:hypothetical protein
MKIQEIICVLLSNFSGPGETVASRDDSATSVGLTSSSRLDFDAKKDDIFLCILTQIHHQCKQMIQNEM